MVVIKRTEPQQTQERSFAFTLQDVLADGVDTPFLRDYRARAWKTFQSLPMPNTRDEAWRRTDLRQMPVETFQPVRSAAKRGERVPPALLRPLVGRQHSGQLLLSPAAAALRIEEDELTRQGVIFSSIPQAAQQHPQVVEKVLGQVVRPEEGKFAALAAAMLRDAALVYVPRGVQVNAPLHSVFWGAPGNQALFSYLIVWLEEGASLAYVHEWASPLEKQAQSMHAGVVEVHVGDAASLQFVELQSWGTHVWNFTHERAVVGRDGNLDWIFGAVGSHLTKNFTSLDLNGQGANGRMSGFYFTDGVQHLDHDTQQNHLVPNTSSDLLFKGALQGQSRSVWQGMIYVAPGAQKTDGYQANRNLVLSPQARADSIPGLEIMANDVRCTHGATVGKIDPEQIFFLRSRGIPKAEAERVVVEGFFDQVMQRIPFDGVRTRFKQSILHKMTKKGIITS